MSSICKVVASGYSESFILFNFDSSTGQADSVTTFTSDKNLSFSAYDKTKGNLYCVHEISNYEVVKNGQKTTAESGEPEETGAVSRWKFDKDGNITKKEVLPSGGTDPAHVVLDCDRGLLFVTNYGGGTFKVFGLNSEDGAIMEKPIYFEKFKGGSQVDKERNDAPHPHGTFLHKDYAYVVDLGSEKIYHYKYTSSKVMKATPEETLMEAGSGPRHLAIDHERGRAYVLSELKTHVTTYDIDETSGALKKLQNISYDIPFKTAGTRQYGAGILIHPKGFLYISNRGDGALVLFKISEESSECLSQVEAVQTGGTWPRYFAISEDGRHILVADQFKGIVSVFVVDEATGKLTKGSEFACSNSPTMLVFL